MSASDSEKAEHVVGAIVGHEESEDPYAWSFTIKWKNYDEETSDELNGFMMEGSWKVENMVAHYLATAFEGSKRLIKQKLNGQTKFGVWPVVKFHEEASWQQLDDICCSAENRAFAKQYLENQFPNKKMMSRRDRNGKVMGYIVVDKA